MPLLFKTLSRNQLFQAGGATGNCLSVALPVKKTVSVKKSVIFLNYRKITFFMVNLPIFEKKLNIYTKINDDFRIIL